jgi:hypothetical protein
MAKGHKTGGRVKGTPNKATIEVKALAQQHGPECIAGLALLAKTAENEQARIAAMRELLDRAYGKPSQAVTGPDGEALQVPHSVSFILRQIPGAENRS